MSAAHALVQPALDVKRYAEVFKRAMRDPLAVRDDEIELLTESDRELVALRCEVEEGMLGAMVIRSLGGVPPARKHRLSDARLRQLCAAARRPGFRVSDVPAQEFALLCANSEQSAVFERAVGEGLDADLGGTP